MRENPPMVADSELPSVAVVVPVRNAERTLDTTLSYLDAVDYPRDRFEIVLADGGSTDSTVAIVRRWQERYAHIRLVEVPDCASPGHARNAALKSIAASIVLFTDGDCAPNADWARRLVAPFLANPEIGGVGGEVLTLRTEPENLTETYCEQTGFLSVAGRCGVGESGYLPLVRDSAPHEVNGGDNSPFFATANVAFRREAIAAAGGEFWAEPTGEDVDFCLRVQAAGFRLYFAREAVVRHMHRVSLRSYLKQWHGYGYGHPLLVAKHAAPGFEIVLQTGSRPIYVRLPGPRGIVHIGAFHLMHVAAAVTAIAGVSAALTGAGLPLLVAGAVATAGSTVSYFAPCRQLEPKASFLKWCQIRYQSNWAFVRGALDGSRRFGPICIEPSW